MAEYKPNGRFLFIVFLNFALLAMSLYAVYFSLTNEIEFAGKYEGMTKEPLITAFAVVAFCYVISCSVIVIHLIKNKGNVMTITYDGVKNGLMMVNVACIFVILPVKFIPWQAITGVEDENGMINAKVDTTKVKANIFAKLLLRFSGFDFCCKRTSPGIYKEDIMMFSDLFTVKSSLQR